MAMTWCATLLLAASTGPAAAILFAPERQTVPVRTILQVMNASAFSSIAQATGCFALAAATPTTSRAAQDTAAAAGAIEAAIAAMRRFPDSKEVQTACTAANGRAILFNRENGLRAGRLGGLNLTLAAYGRWMDDQRVTSTMGGDIGCYLDYCDENRAIFRELKGPQLLIQNIKNNFHGQYSEWAYFTVLNSLYGLSSGCWKCQDLCYQEGFVELAVRLMDEHTSDQKIAEETLQAVKALLYYSPGEYRKALAEAGLAGKLVKVLRENPTDRGAVSLACETMATFVGPYFLAGPGGSTVRPIPFSPEVQTLATEAGAVEQLLDTATSGAHLEHRGHGFNFDVDLAYNADADCLNALAGMANENSANQKTMIKAGLAEHLSTQLQQEELNSRVREGACTVMGMLLKSGESLPATATSTFKSSCEAQ